MTRVLQNTHSRGIHHKLGERAKQEERKGPKTGIISRWKQSSHRVDCKSKLAEHHSSASFQHLCKKISPGLHIESTSRPDTRLATRNTGKSIGFAVWNEGWYVYYGYMYQLSSDLQLFKQSHPKDLRFALKTTTTKKTCSQFMKDWAHSCFYTSHSAHTRTHTHTNSASDAWK